MNTTWLYLLEKRYTEIIAYFFLSFGISDFLEMLVISKIRINFSAVAEELFFHLLDGEVQYPQVYL